MEKKIERANTLAIIAIIMASLSLLLTFVANVKTDGGESALSTSASEETNYDTTMFKTLSLKGVIDLFDSKETYVVYLGREDCSACVAFLPTLKNMQTKYNYITQYLDINGVMSGTDDYNNLMNKLSKEVTLTINGETKTDKFGNFFGYTPMTFIIKNGKFQDGIVGAYNETRFETFLNNNGIK